jgi:hypothetical protein
MKWKHIHNKKPPAVRLIEALGKKYMTDKMDTREKLKQRMVETIFYTFSDILENVNSRNYKVLLEILYI